MADLIIVHDKGSGDPILLNRDTIVKGREYKQHGKGNATSLDLLAGKSVVVQESLQEVMLAP